MNKAKRQHRKKRYSVAQKMWIGFGVVVTAIAVLFVLIYNGVIGYMPEIDELRSPTDRYASTIYSNDGTEMGRFFRAKDNRLYADYNQLPLHLTQALVATEDVRFYDHSGIDVRGLGRAIIKRVVMGQGNAGGGSTITQQLAKQLYSNDTAFTERATTLFERAMQKPVEWMIAVKLERFYTKDEILQMYFNQFDFLNNAVGIKMAAYVYFNKEPSQLSLLESATLVGMCKNPAYFNPRRFNERTRLRRNVVLDQMVNAGYLDAAKCDVLKQQPLALNFHKVADHNEGPAPYFREELRRVMTAKKPQRKDYPKWDEQQYVSDSVAWVVNPLYGWCHKNHKANGDEYDIYKDGLKIYTTIDLKMQKYAEEALVDHLKNDLQPAFKNERGGMSNPYTTTSVPGGRQALINAAIRRTDRYHVLKRAGKSENEIMSNFHQKVHMTVFDYNGGYETEMTPLDSMLYVKSYLRSSLMSMDPATGYVKAYVGGPDFHFFKYDMVSKGRRQIGSTVKPFVYSQAIEYGGLTPCTVRPVGPPNIYWQGHYWNPRGGGGAMSLRTALTTSNNWMSAGFMRGTRMNWIERDGHYTMTPEDLVKWMHSFGITSYLDPQPALSLGSSEITLREMVAAYSAFANGGMRVEPLYVSRITDDKGVVLAEFTPQQTEIMSQDTYLKMLSMLLNVVNAGTGSRLRSYGIPAQIGGKTGTTNTNCDGWFMGFTPDLVTGVWTGGEERYIHFTSGFIGQGAVASLPTLGKYLQSVYSDSSLPYASSSGKFKIPAGYNECADELGPVPGSGGGGRRSGGGAQAAEPKPNGGGGGGAPAVEGVFD